MVRGIGYMVARRDPDDPEEPRNWALLIETFLRGLFARLAGGRPLPRRRRAQRRDSASAKRPR